MKHILEDCCAPDFEDLKKHIATLTKDRDFYRSIANSIGVGGSAQNPRYKGDRNLHIVAERLDGMTYAEIAAKFQISKSTVIRICEKHARIVRRAIDSAP